MPHTMRGQKRLEDHMHSTLRRHSPALPTCRYLHSILGWTQEHRQKLTRKVKESIRTPTQIM